MGLSDYHFGCHGIHERCFLFKGKPMPFCARCLGVSIGHISVSVNFFLFQLPPIWISIFGLALMFGDWFCQNKLNLYHSNYARLITGILGGYSVGLILWKMIQYLSIYTGFM